MDGMGHVRLRTEMEQKVNLSKLDIHEANEPSMFLIQDMIMVAIRDFAFLIVGSVVGVESGAIQQYTILKVSSTYIAILIVNVATGWDVAARVLYKIKLITNLVNTDIEWTLL